MYRVPVFTLGTTLSPYTTPHTHTQTRASARAGPALSLSFFFFLFFPLDPAISRASCASFYSFRTRALAFTRTHAWSRTHATERFAHTTRVPFVRFFLFSFSPQPPSRETTLAPSGRRAAAARRE